MQCPHCGHEVPIGRFCLACGRALAVPTQVAPGSGPVLSPAVAAPSQRRPVGLLIAILAAIALLAVLLFAVVRGQLVASSSPRDPSPAPVIATPPAPTEISPPITAQPPPPAGPPPTVAPPPLRVQMPPEVRRYLEWLSRIETQRINVEEWANRVTPSLLAGGLTDAMLGMVDEGEGESKLRNTIAIFEQAGQRAAGVLRLFTTTAPPVPAECLTLHRTYGQALQAWIAVYDQMKTLVAKALGGGTPPSPTQRAAIGNESYESSLNLANNELGAIFSRYRIQPWFRIQPVPTGGVLGGGVRLPGF